MQERKEGADFSRALSRFRTVLSENDILGRDLFFDRIVSSQGFSVRSYENGECIFSPQAFERALAFLLEGKAVAVKTNAGGDVAVSRFQPGSLFGLAALFAEDEPYASEIRVVSRKALVVFVPQETVAEILSASPEASLAYIRLLSQKIRFLNAKLDAFTAPNALAKLSLFLAEQNGSKLSMLALANTLNISRMTLYRALDELTKDGSIQRSGKTVTVTDRAKLLSHLTESAERESDSENKPSRKDIL